ncbi:hypothetical protein BGZ61DRAFT_537748 [Ilyonectria robusta]|uniref:uncharacterized protein n=1 Tax=Ilyonectria robusta TaxID=1079257 RepID=UPI001E8DBADF|nr:uncharacterized protein BGZ61DRAFT_537748 [Ilyonectria robusta]KAH8669326.1 hypothetical protein BGZ61DRAFT_537748 [Ilyonectria robusta]
MLGQERPKKRRIRNEFDQERVGAKATAAREKKKEMTKRENMANAYEIGNSMDDVKVDEMEKEPEPPSKIPRLETIQEEEDECLEPAPKIARPDNILEEAEDLAWEMSQDLEAAVRHKCHKSLKPSPRQQHHTVTHPPASPRHAPRMSTQAIPFNLDDFPSSSQQAYGLEDDLFLSAPPAPEIDEEKSSEEKEEEAAELMPSTPHDPGPESPPSSPRRFFTPTGDHARMALALHRSRRTAALEEIQRRYRPRIKAVTEEAAAQPPEPGKSLPNINQPKSSPPPYPSLHDEEGNYSSPPSQEPAIPDASQDSYGGDWVDEIALELLV